MRHYRNAVWLISALLGAPLAAQADPAPTAQVETERDLAAMRQWLADSSRWTGQHNQVLAGRVGHLTALGNGASPIQRLALSGDKAGAEAAAARWKTEQQAVLAGDRAALAAIPPLAKLDVNPALLARPDIRQGLAGPIAHIEGLPARYVAFMEMTDRQAADYMDTIAAAGASPDPGQAFSLARIELVIALFDSESVLLDTTRPPGGVQRFVSAANIQSDKALSQWYRHVHDLWSQAQPERAGRASAIHACAAEIRLDADRIVEAARQQDEEQRSNPGMTSPAQQTFLTRYREAFEDAAGIEREMATLLDQLADALAGGEDEAGQTLADRSGDISRRRVAAQNERNALLQQLALLVVVHATVDQREAQAEAQAAGRAPDA